MLPTSIRLEDVWLEYPIYGAGARSLRQTLVSMATAGRLARRADGTKRVRALKGISLDIREGDRVGLIGSNGAGKTSLLRLLAGAMWPSKGHLRRVGMTSSLFDVYLGMNFEANGWDNIILRGLFLGLPVPEIRAHTDEIVAFSGLTPEQLSRPVRTYSSGMAMRLAFSVSTFLNPDILLLDEWLWVSDATFVQRAQQRMHDLVQQTRILVIATHAEYLIQQLCNKAVYLRQGELVYFGSVDEAFAAYHQDSALAA
ncbi:MAG TPA: ABC transporter ATP-binding protein [Acetobacteraceae bacterium]|nr:ABC transporter ATP-binding protein [Acetobacteraceae bacterium]